MNVQERELQYYNQTRCETCIYHCENPRKQKYKYEPWVCGNEKSPCFTNPTEPESHNSCKYWESKLKYGDISGWLKRCKDMIQKVKDPKGKYYTDRSKYRNVYQFASTILEWYNHSKNFSSEPLQTTALRYGISQQTVKKLIDISKEDANDSNG